MAQNFSITRVLTTVTTETSSQTAVLTEVSAGVWLLDFKATINSVVRLVHRFKITGVVSGQSQRFRVQHLDYTSAADSGTAYTDGLQTTPFTEAEADAITDVTEGFSPLINVDNIYTLGGDTGGV